MALALVLVPALACVVAAIDAPWQQYGFDAARSGSTQAPQVTNRLAWTHAAPGSVEDSPVVDRAQNLCVSGGRGEGAVGRGALPGAALRPDGGGSDRGDP